MDFIDISEWNEKIERAFAEAKKHLPQYKDELKIIENVLSHSLNTEERLVLERRQKELDSIINDLMNDTSFGFYLLEVQNYLDEFQSAVKTQPAISFMKKDRKHTEQTSELAKSFIELIQKYNTILQLNIPSATPSSKKKMGCGACGNSKDFDVVDGRVYYCVCGVQVKENVGSRVTYKDIDRVNASSKYKYARVIHMKNCIRQFQGKQNVKIPPKCIRETQEQLRINSKFINPSPQDVRKALQETGWSSQYENFILIWSLITKKPCPDISHLEAAILEDFELIEREYNIVTSDPNEDRSSFMSYPFVLYHDLRRHKYPCDLVFFNMLKSDRIDWLNDTMETIYTRLEWNGFERLEV